MHDSISAVPVFINFHPSILEHGQLDLTLYIIDRFEEAHANQEYLQDSVCEYTNRNLEHAVTQRISLLGPSK